MYQNGLAVAHGLERRRRPIRVALGAMTRRHRKSTPSSHWNSDFGTASSACGPAVSRSAKAWAAASQATWFQKAHALSVQSVGIGPVKDNQAWPRNGALDGVRDALRKRPAPSGYVWVGFWGDAGPGRKWGPPLMRNSGAGDRGYGVFA
jgi:hypothetical protein